jgi:hypothetical protein
LCLIIGEKPQRMLETARSPGEAHLDADRARLARG